MTPAMEIAHAVHSGAECMSTGSSVSRARTAIDKENPITIALLRASIPFEALEGAEAVRLSGVSVAFILLVSVDECGDTRMVVGVRK